MLNKPIPLPTVASSVDPVPADIVACFNQVTQFPTNHTLNSAQMVDLVVDLRESEIEKTLCGKRLIAWAEGQRAKSEKIKFSS